MARDEELETLFSPVCYNEPRSVEKENSAPDEEMVEGRGRMLRPATTRIRPEFRLRNQTKQTQCDKIKAKPTLRCHLKIVCSRILLNCPRHLSRTEVPLHCSSNSSSVAAAMQRNFGPTKVSRAI